MVVIESLMKCGHLYHFLDVFTSSFIIEDIHIEDYLAHTYIIHINTYMPIYVYTTIYLHTIHTYIYCVFVSLACSGVAAYCEFFDVLCEM